MTPTRIELFSPVFLLREGSVGHFDGLFELFLHLALGTGGTEGGDETVLAQGPSDAIHHPRLEPHGQQRLRHTTHHTHRLPHVAGCLKQDR